jgi:phosphatidylinositol kinase/protein kinase (PI-3  family)
MLHISFRPLFHEWFLETFPEPTAWFASRLNYSRTAAVISMVGYIIGLGDRHCENIMLDEGTGETVHCDFNCLFDKVSSVSNYSGDNIKPVEGETIRRTRVGAFPADSEYC